MKQVVTIGSDGTVAGLQHKPGKGFDLRKLGKADIQRASEVVWDADHQEWRVEFREGAGKYAGEILTDLIAQEALGHTWERQFPLLGLTRAGNARIFGFLEYDDAVAAEIKVLDGLRLRGKLNSKTGPEDAASDPV